MKPTIFNRISDLEIKIIVDKCKATIYNHAWKTIIFAICCSLAIPLVNAKTNEKQLQVTPVDNLTYYGVFPNGVSSFETADAKCFVNNSQRSRDDRSRVAISCFKK